MRSSPICRSLPLQELFVQQRSNTPRIIVASPDMLQVAPTAKALAEQCEIVLAMVADPEAALQLATGPDGIAAGMGAGKGYVDASTIDAGTAQKINEVSIQSHVEVMLNPTDIPVGLSSAVCGAGSAQSPGGHQLLKCCTTAMRHSCMRCCTIVIPHSCMRCCTTVMPDSLTAA